MTTMLAPFLAIILGIVVLVISADKFVEGAAAMAKRLGLPPLLIGMLVIGFGSSMPEMVISALSAWGGNPGLAMGNAIGSNIANIALILGLTAVITPIAVASSVIRRELPYLTAVTVLLAGLLYIDGSLSRLDGILLMGLFSIIMAWSIYAGLRTESDALAEEVEQVLAHPMSMPKSLIYTILGLVFLVISSRILVWGGVEVATHLGVSDLVIGLTIVAIGTSLPELAASLVAVRKGEHDLALGNVIGSNMFNTTIVVGITGVISPTLLDEALLTRDLPIMGILTAALFVMAYNYRGNENGVITRLEGGLLLFAYVAYNTGLVYSIAS